MIAVDTNILVYGHREDSVWHEPAFTKLKSLIEGGLDWAIPWACVHEFLSITTHPKIYKPPTPLKNAIDQLEAWFESPTLRLIGEGDRYWDKLKETLSLGKIQGAMVHDARIASLCAFHGVTVLWTADRDFSRMKGVRLENPLVSFEKKK